MTTPRFTKHHWVAVLGTAIHVGLVVWILWLYVSEVPKTKRFCEEFDVIPPWATMNVIRASEWISDYSWALAPVIVLLAAGEFRLLSRADRTANRIWIKSGGVLALGLVGMCVGLTTIVAKDLVTNTRQGESTNWLPRKKRNG